MQAVMSHSSLAFTGDNSWKQFSNNFKAIFRGSSFCTFGGILTSDSGQIRWKPQMLSFPASASVENHVLAAFERFQGDFEGGLRFVLLVGFCTKRRPWPNSLKTANVIVPRYYFRLESCLVYFQAISRRFWRGLRFWVFGLRFVPTHGSFVCNSLCRFQTFIYNMICIFKDFQSSLKHPLLSK